MKEKIVLFACACIGLNTGFGGLFNAVGSAVMNSANNPCPLFNETLVPMKTVYQNQTEKPGGRKLLATYVYSSHSSSDAKETYYVDTGNGTGYYATSNTPNICGMWPMRLALCGLVGGSIWGICAAIVALSVFRNNEQTGDVGFWMVVVTVLFGIATAFFAAPIGVQIIGCDTPHCQRESFETNSIGFLCGPCVLYIIAFTSVFIALDIDVY